jgi:hypothetical protein
MSTSPVQVILLARAFNDLDCRLPLLREFSSRRGFSVSVMIIPTVSSSGYRVTHPLLAEMEIPCVYIIDLLKQKWVRNIYFWLSYFVEQSSVSVISHRVWIWCWRIMYKRISNSLDLSSTFVNLTSNTLLIIDDILVTPSRSFIVSLIRRENSAKLFCLSHGQNTYINLWHDKSFSYAAVNTHDPNLTIYTPSDNDARILEFNYKGIKAITVGNTRFDKEWVLNYQEKLLKSNKKLSPYGGTKIVFMMSKMEYGLDSVEVFKVINHIAGRDNTKIVLKPHTRGMSLGKYANLMNENVIIADDVPSSEIINWSDIVVFTGSSIIFEAMIKRKRVLFLAALQKYQTIFDKLPPLCIFKSGANVNDAISQVQSEAYDYDSIDQFVTSNAYNHIPEGRVCAALAERIISELAPRV